MKKRRNYYPMIYGIVLILVSVYLLLDTFVISRSYAAVDDNDYGMQAIADEAEEAIPTEPAQIVSTDTSYSDGSITVTLTAYREYNTNIYVADVVLSDYADLKTAFAKDTYGKNITQTTSSIASEKGAILAINGDYYGARASGYVIRNGAMYRSASAGSEQEDLVLYADGSMEIVREAEVTAQALLDRGAVQVLSFGPGLVADGTVTVAENDEVDKAMTSNKNHP